MKNLFTTSLLLIFGLLSLASYVHAQTPSPIGCEPVYGGGENCPASNIAINKLVLNPQTNQYIDNLGINDYLYKPGDLVTFQIHITNTSNTTLSTATVKDIFPKFLDFSTGPGKFDASSKTLTFSADNLTPNQTQNFIVTGKVASADQILQMQGSCMVNQAVVTNSNGQSIQDSAQFCISLPTTAVNQSSSNSNIAVTSIPNSSSPLATTPKTGTDDFIWVGLFAIGLLGYQIRNYAIKI